MGLVFPAKAGTYTTVAYGNLLVAGSYGFPPARERRDNEKALLGRRREGRLYGTAVRNRTRLVTDSGAVTSQGRTGAALYRVRTAGYSAFGGWMDGAVLEATTACSTVSRATDLHSGLLRSQSLR